MVRAMLDILISAILLAAQPVAFVGYVVAGVAARSVLHAIGYAIAWAVAMQLFIVVTSGGFGAPDVLVVQLVMRTVGSVVLTLGVYLLNRAMRGGPGGGPRPGGKSGTPPPKKPPHLRRIK